jgi:hypothetical protein
MTLSRPTLQDVDHALAIGLVEMPISGRFGRPASRADAIDATAPKPTALRKFLLVQAIIVVPPLTCELLSA